MLLRITFTEEAKEGPYYLIALQLSVRTKKKKKNGIVNKTDSE